MKSTKTLDLVYIALGAALIVVCSWISIPMAVPFTLQTFAVFAVLGILGGKRGTCSILVYMLLGAIGLPVFAGFKSGIGVLFGMTGGYIIGFLLTGILYWIMVGNLGKKLWVQALAMVIGLAVCYLFGTLWFIQVYTKSKGAIGMMATLSMCVFPFIIPDLIKLAIALVISKRVGKIIKD